MSRFSTNNVTNMSTMFWQCDKLKELDISKFDMTNVTDMTGMLEIYSLEKISVGENFNVNVYPASVDGNWYTADGTAYTPQEIANRNVADTYYAVNPNIL